MGRAPVSEPSRSGVRVSVMRSREQVLRCTWDAHMFSVYDDDKLLQTDAAHGFSMVVPFWTASPTNGHGTYKFCGSHGGPCQYMQRQLTGMAWTAINDHRAGAGDTVEREDLQHTKRG